jgi:tetratricopeptide (TPR) repeat protein
VERQTVGNNRQHRLFAGPRKPLCIVSALIGQLVRVAFEIVLISVCCALLAFAQPRAEDPAAALQRAFEAAKSSLAAGNVREAEQRYRQAIVVALRQLANLSVSESRFDEATRELEEALKVSPGDADAAADAAIASFRAGNVERARQLVEKALTVNPENKRAQNVLGRIDLYEGKFDDAIRDLQTSLQMENDFETAYFLGIAYLKNKRSSDAQAWFEHLQAVYGNSPALHVLIGRAYSLAHFPEPAIVEFRKAIQLDPHYHHAHGLLGFSLLELRGEEAYPAARKEFELELKVHPDDYNARLLLGISADALRDFPAAEAALLYAKRLRPDEAFPYLYLGEIYSNSKRYPQAIGALQEYIRLVHNPEDVARDVSRAYYLLGQDLRRLGRLEEAQKALTSSQKYREAKFRYDAQHIFDEPGKPSDGDSHTSDRLAGLLESSEFNNRKAAQEMAQGGVQNEAPGRPAPDPPQALESKAAKQYRAFVAEILARSYNDLGVLRAKEANFAEAAHFFKQAAAWKPTLPGLDRNWGLASYRAQAYSEAIPPLQRLLNAKPDDAFVRQLLGLSYFFTEDFSKTAEVLQPFVKSPPDDPGLLFAWGTSLVRVRQPQLAEQIFRRLLEQHSSDPNVHFLLGQAYAQQNDNSSALAEFQSALKLDPHLPEVHYSIGLVHLESSNFESAVQEFRSELEIRPGDPLTSYHLGYALLLEGQIEAAVPILRKVVEAKPDYELARFTLGRALLQQGDSAGAIEHLEVAIKLNPDRDATYFQLSQAYRRAGRMDDAAKALATYQKLIESSRQKRREALEANKP